MHLTEIDDGDDFMHKLKDLPSVGELIRFLIENKPLLYVERDGTAHYYRNGDFRHVLLAGQLLGFFELYKLHVDGFIGSTNHKGAEIRDQDNNLVGAIGIKQLDPKIIDNCVEINYTDDAKVRHVIIYDASKQEIRYNSQVYKVKKP